MSALARFSKLLSVPFFKATFGSARVTRGCRYNSVLWPLIGRYVKEGLVMAPHLTHDLAPLLRYESSNLEEGQLTSLAEYAACRLPRCAGTALVTARDFTGTRPA